jgi:hypothetical protein
MVLQEGIPMSDSHLPPPLRTAVIGLLDHMRGQERHFEAALSDAERSEDGSPERFGARAVLAHVTDFKREQVERVEAAIRSVDPPERTELDADAAYAAYLSRGWDEVSADAEQTATRLRAGTEAIEEAQLFTAGIYPWLRGRALWAQILVRGVWHPSAHLHQYLAEHDHVDRVVLLQQGLVDAATELQIPDVPGGRPFALYNLACAHALAGEVEQTLARLAETIRVDPGRAESARSDPDFALLRDLPAFAKLVASAP